MEMSLNSNFPTHLYLLFAMGDEHELFYSSSFELQYKMLVAILVIECLAIKGIPHAIACT